jgi:hypothetical protein
MAKLYDTKCYELAEEFLKDSSVGNASSSTFEQYADLLAKDIQQTIEDFFSDKKLT